MLTESAEDTRRKLIEIHLEAAKKRISPQTGFLHLFYDDPKALEQNTIPLLENMYYALALFRTRMSDPILEAKQIIEKVLPFEVEGNFPIYIHHYPSCKDRCLSLHLLPVIHYLLTDYKQVLGEELIKKLEDLSIRIVRHGRAIELTKKLPFGAEVKLAAFTKQLTPKTPSSSQEWGEYLLALHMSHPASWLEEQVIKNAASQWNRSLNLYVGEGKVQAQDGYFPKATLFDLFMGMQTGGFSESALQNINLLLSASLVHAFPYEISQFPFNEEFLVVLTSNEPKQPVVLFWKEKQALRSAAIEVSGGLASIEKHPDGITLQCIYPEVLPMDEDNAEIALYIDASRHAELIVDGSRASTFLISQDVKIETEEHSVILAFSLEEGEGRFFGHISKANRSMQARKEAYTAYDWKVGLRTIQRSERCALKMRIAFQ